MIAPRLLATCWTSAGDAAPQVSDELSPIDLETRMRTAARAGWTGFGLVHADLVAYRDAHGLASLASLAEDCGIERIELEFLGDWWTTGEQRKASDLVRHDLLEAAHALSVPVIKIAPAMDVAPPTDIFLTELDLLVAEAKERGTTVAIEPMPFSSNIRSLDDGMRLIDTLAQDSLGLVVDIWHAYRGGMDYARIPELIPPERIAVVELNDGIREPVGSLWDDTINNRLYPGRGAFDVPAFIQAVQAAGFDGYWGVEMISAEHRSRPISQSLPELAAATRDCFVLPEKEHQ